MDITDLNQTAANSDRLTHLWINAARAKMLDLEQQLALAYQQIQELKAQTAQAFRVSIVSGLSLAYAGGTLKVKSTGLILSIPPGNLTAPANTISYVQIDTNGNVSVSATRPSSGLEIARLQTSATAVTSLQNYPLFEARTAEPDLNNYATIDYANSRAWRQQATGRKTAVFNIPATDTYYRIPLESLDGAGFATNGVFTAPLAGKYIFASRIRVDTLSPSNPLAVKLSLFVNGVEILLAQGESARGDFSTSVMNNEPVQLAQNGQAEMKIYLTAGVQSRVREGSSVVAWLVP